MRGTQNISRAGNQMSVDNFLVLYRYRLDRCLTVVLIYNAGIGTRAIELWPEFRLNVQYSGEFYRISRRNSGN
jgi:hypothetical protein